MVEHAPRTGPRLNEDRGRLKIIDNQDNPAPAYGQPARTPTRIPPHDLGAEQSLLGAMLMSPIAIDHALRAGIEPRDFYGAGHAGIFEACVELREGDIAVDAVTVASYVTEQHLPIPPRVADWGSYLVELLTATPVIGHAAAYAKIVHDKAESRRALWQLAKAIDGGAAALYNGEPASDALGDVIVALQDAHQVTEASGKNTWAPIDLTSQTIIEERPYMLTRTDGGALIYIGKVNSLSGPPESAKSWASLLACAQLAKRGAHSAYIDYEDNPASIAGRLRALGLDDAQLAYVHYYWPDTSLDHALPALQALGVDLDLVVVDSNTRATLAAGGKTNDTDDAASLGRTLARIARTLGAGVFLLDHVTKDDDPNSPYARGSGDKLAYIDGAAYKVKVTNLFAPGRVGTAEILCVKDRPGGARGDFAYGRVAGTFRMTSDAVGEPVAASITPSVASEDSAGDFRPTGYMERVSRAMETLAEPIGVKELRKIVPGKSNTARDAAIRALVTEEYVSVEPGPRGAKLHTLIKPFREHAERESAHA